MDLEHLAWRKGSLVSTDGGDRVEVAELPDGGRALRDSKDPQGAILQFTAPEWAAFIAGVAAGEFDR